MVKKNALKTHHLSRNRVTIAPRDSGLSVEFSNLKRDIMQSVI